MRMLTKEQLNKMNEWMQVNARPYDRAKWNYLFNGGSKEQIVEEMLKYQNADGGMGSGFEADVLCPLSVTPIKTVSESKSGKAQGLQPRVTSVRLRNF